MYQVLSAAAAQVLAAAARPLALQSQAQAQGNRHQGRRCLPGLSTDPHLAVPSRQISAESAAALQADDPLTPPFSRSRSNNSFSGMPAAECLEYCNTDFALLDGCAVYGAST